MTVLNRSRGMRGFVVAGVLVMIVVILAVGSWAYRSRTGTAPLTGPESPHPVALGAFLGADEKGVDRLEGFTSWLGVPVTVGRSYLPAASWDDLEGPDWVLDPWTAWRSERPGRVLAVNVPMAAPNEPAVGDAEVASLLRDGADGRFDAHFRKLAQRLVDRRANDTIIVL